MYVDRVDILRATNIEYAGSGGVLEGVHSPHTECILTVLCCLLIN